MINHLTRLYTGLCIANRSILPQG